MSRTITLYSLPDCSQCNMTKRWLDRAGVEYRTVMLDQSPDDKALMDRLGYKQAPIVIVDSEDDMFESGAWSGFRPDELAKYAGPIL